MTADLADVTESRDKLPRGSGLAWPPLAEDLKRLYLEQKLSAAKIAKVYGLNYASEKTAESTILHHLKKNGIRRRDAAAHVRKVTDSMVDDWILRYQKGESLKQIAGREVGPVTVFNHLRKRGLKLRDKVEAQISAVKKFQKHSFDGGAFEKGYFLGLARGDLNVKRHGRAVRIRTSSTHPAMIDLVTSILAPYGPVRVRPRLSRLVGYEWSVEAELDFSFKFLLDEAGKVPGENCELEFVRGYLAVLFDAEGSVWLRGDRTFEPRMSFTNKDFQLLSWVQNRLSEFGFHSHLGKPNIEGVRQLQSWRVKEVGLVSKLLRIKHPEKKAKFRLLLSSLSIPERRRRWQSLLEQIEGDRRDFIQLAQAILRERAETASHSQDRPITKMLNNSSRSVVNQHISDRPPQANNSIPSTRAGCPRCAPPSEGAGSPSCS